MEKREFKKMNKKAGEKLLSIWWFLVLVFIGGSIAIGVGIYYSFEINVNGLEAEVLANRISNCIIENGYLNKDFLNNNFDIFKECRLDSRVFGKGSNFYFKISIYSETGTEKEIFGGDSSFEKECNIAESIIAKHFSKCSKKTENALIGEKNMQVIILTGVKQNGKSYSIVQN